MSVPAISDPLASTTRERVMVDYRVHFFNNLVTYGKPFKCLQRAITVSSAKDAGEAVELPKGNRAALIPLGSGLLEPLARLDVVLCHAFTVLI
jgi:hypothetical protein